MDVSQLAEPKCGQPIILGKMYMQRHTLYFCATVYDTVYDKVRGTRLYSV